ncbi:MAG TPA: RES family NAD+ phosphorylase [Pirellulales bacterium]|nr:RES family NAD+ phosphorylase [Pirellulales bacterium]
MKLASCASLVLGPTTGTWYRAVQPKHWPTSLTTAHTKTIPSRFGAGTTAHPGFEILYLAEDQQVALFEVQALLGSPLPGAAYAPNPAQTWVIVNVSVALSKVADLCHVPERKKIQTSVQELTGDWRGYGLRSPNARLAAPYWSNVPTQKLGAELYNVRDLEAFVTYSAKVPTRRNLVVFPQKLLPGSRLTLRFFNPHTLATHTERIGP